MRFLFTIGAIVLCAYFAAAQGGFKKRNFIKHSSYASCRDVIEAPNGNLIGVGIRNDTIAGSYKLTLLGMDPSGNPLWEKTYGDSNVLYFDNYFHGRGPIVYDSLFFYRTLSAWNGKHPRSFGVLIKFNYNGDTIWQRKYTTPDTLEDVIPQGLTKSVDGGFLITGLFQKWSSNGYRKCLVIKTDKNGNELWRKKIGKAAPDVQDGKSIVQDSATKRIVVVGYQYIGPANNVGDFGNVLILDSLGNKIHQVTYNNFGGGSFIEVIQLKDKNFLLCGTINANNDLGNHTRYYSLVVKFDSNGTKLWSKTFDTLSFMNSINQLYELNNGDIITSGYLDTMLNHNILEQARIKVARLDKNGNRMWQKYVGGYNNEFPRSLNPTKDGGFVIGVLDIYQQDPNIFSIIKIDSTGCDTLESYCKSQTVDVTRLQEYYGFEFDVFPNPATDKINFLIDAPREKEFRLEVRETSGRLVESVYINGGIENRLNTENYSDGIYLMSVFYEGKRCETRKVMVTH